VPGNSASASTISSVTDAQSWLNLQQQYEIHCAQDSLGKALAAIRPWHDASAAA
jgi:plasmid maintenance system antidote protein VapI